MENVLRLKSSKADRSLSRLAHRVNVWRKLGIGFRRYDLAVISYQNGPKRTDTGC